ncbi:MAG: 2-oxoglutarate dehydrogenase complex dihydrolipoyllysine-residue succinyltransferase [Verrucomicrobiota bacterium]|nr:2-oxoglutarate dehydrogenase complex dihydrolipoyllysine-residue succinyltransferase [Verrucomicrobiota bacterium]
MPIELKIPNVGESITEVTISEWLVKEGDPVSKDQSIAVLESDKATVDLPAPEDGMMGKIIKASGTAKINEVIGHLEPGKVQTKGTSTPSSAKPAATQSKPLTDEGKVMPSAQKMMTEKGVKPETVQPTGMGGRILKEDVLTAMKGSSPVVPKVSENAFRKEEVIPMSPLRKKIAERLVKAQQTGALLTTFNEIDMSSVMSLRKQYQELFQKKHSVKLGFMSFFVKAVIEGLKEFPAINAEVRDDQIVYHHYYDIGIAVGGGKGLVVPVLRNAERLSFAEIEKAISDFGQRAQTGKLGLDELKGGTFTISNGGVYGSLLSTPIVNPPQSGVLGMHGIQDRPIAVDGAVVIRPMMYIALTYDHRIVDGREAVTFVRRIKEVLETPARLLIEV